MAEDNNIPGMTLALPLPAGLAWCEQCGAAKPAGHECGPDPLDEMSAPELRALVRVMRLARPDCSGDCSWGAPHGGECPEAAK